MAFTIHMDGVPTPVGYVKTTEELRVFGVATTTTDKGTLIKKSLKTIGGFKACKLEDVKCFEFCTWEELIFNLTPSNGTEKI